MKKIIYIIMFIVISILGLEIFSFHYLRYKNPNYKKVEKEFNRQISGYSIFQNTANYEHQRSLSFEKYEPIITDSFGFIRNRHKTKCIEKCIEIIINGGSTAISAGQNYRYKEYHKPSGIYPFELSIAGKLEVKLNLAYPDKCINVINAAGYTKTMHLSFTEYLSKISLLQPELIIQIDGFNDIGSIVSGKPFELYEKLWLEHYIDLHKSTYNQSKSNLLNFITLFSKSHSQKKTKKYEVYSYSENSKKDFFLIKEEIENRSKRFLQILDYYLSILEKDNVTTIYCLQPILDREPNKELSNIEKKMRKIDALFDPSFFPYIPEDILNSDIEGNQVLKKSKLSLRYIWDDFLSEKIQNTVKNNNAIFIDLGEEVLNLNGDFELYTDYCHLTSQGNEFVAEKLARQIIENNLLEKSSNKLINTSILHDQ